MGTLLFIIVVALVLAALLGAGGYSVRRYWSPAGSEVVETSDTYGAGAGIAAALVALLVLILVFFGFTRWSWFGNSPSQGQPNTPVVTSPAPSGGSTPSSSPSSTPSSSPSASPS